MAEWLEQLRQAMAGGPAALITILATEGSAPREAGARMVITVDSIQGSIGGGNLEYQAVAQARAALDQPPGTWRVQDYPLGPLLNQCCGGKVRLLIEHVDGEQVEWLNAAADHAAQLVATLTDDAVLRAWGAKPDAELPSVRGDRPQAGAVFIEPWEGKRQQVLMFGAGHVGQAIIRGSYGLPLDFHWYDNRPEMAGTDGLIAADPAAMIEAARHCPDDTRLLILTHDHDLDYRLLAAALNSPAPFICMIGSMTKRARFLSRLEKEGFGADDLARLVCPIGHPDIRGKQPGVIAVAVLAQLLAMPRV